MTNRNNRNVRYQYSNTDDDATSSSTNSSSSSSSLTEIQESSMITGPLGIDPLAFTETLFFCLLLWIVYLLLPKGVRVTYCDSYPKRYAWSSRSKRRRQLAQQTKHATLNPVNSAPSTIGSEHSSGLNSNHKQLSAQGIGMGLHRTTTKHPSNEAHEASLTKEDEEEIIDFTPSHQRTTMERTTSTDDAPSTIHVPQHPHPTPHSTVASTFNDEIAISATMQQLRNDGILIVAHGSRGKPKTVRLQLTENAITWRTESSSSSKRKRKTPKSHQVPLTHIMYVDVGKQTTALRRVENASILEGVCLSLLTKEGSLDLEARSGQERDALVNCFSLVLDEVHAQNWRDVYRAPSSDLPSSFDEFDVGSAGNAAGEGGNGQRMEV